MKSARIWSLALLAALAVSAPSYGSIYAIDDGTAEISIGVSGGGSFIWFNQFTVSGGLDMITQIRVAFGRPSDPINGALNGLPFTVVLWEDPNNDGNPGDAVVVTSMGGVVANVDTDTFVVVDIADSLVSGSFFLGALIEHDSDLFPAALDQTAPLANRSFVIAGSNINDLSGAIPIENVGFVGNWLVRADAVPEPSSFALLLPMGTMLIARARLRRKKG